MVFGGSIRASGGGGGGTITALNDATENEIVTVGSTTTELDAESTLTFASNKLIPTASAHNAAGTALTLSAGATTAGTTNNIAGGALTIQGGQGKGSGAGGDIIFQTANAGGSGSSLNALATALTISDDLSVTFAGTIELGHASDTTIARSGSGAVTVEGTAVLLAGAQTGITSILAEDVVIGEDAQTQIDFETANEIHFDADNAEIAKITATGLTMSAGENVYLGDGSSLNISTPLLAGGDHTYSGISAQMLAGGTISAFQLVCIHTTTQEIVVADASAVATARAIGIAPAAISDTATGTVLLHGFIRDYTWNWTTGSVLYLSETAGALTHTAPTTDGAFVQAVGIALEPDVVFINPSLDIIEHA